MVPLIEQHREAIADLCRRHGVLRLEVFGSATDPARFDVEGPGTSDVDFLYVIDEVAPRLVDRYFGLGEDLERLLGRKVDLVSTKDLRNPYFVAQVNEQRSMLYAA